jgi:ABC-2 type transport system ATP-binding protein
VLLLDEPASGLDPEARHALAQLMLRLRAEGISLMVSSHILSELEDYSSDMLILREGRIVEQRMLERPGAGRTRMMVRLSAPDAGLRAVLEHPRVSALAIDGGTARFTFSGDDAQRHALLRDLVEADLAVCAFGEESVSMQDAYLARLAADREARGEVRG